MSEDKRHFGRDPEWVRGVRNALLASFLLGWAPILGKLAYGAGVGPFTLAAFRTLVAVGLLWAVYLAFWRAYLPITWRDLLGCVAVGAIHGIGSLLYYSGLQRLDASLASFLGTLYPIWVVVFLTASGESLSRLTLVRLALVIGGVYVLTGAGSGEPDWLGAVLMVASAAVNGWYMVMGQWVLADVPARTGTLYILTAMGIVVGLARIFQGQAVEPIASVGWAAISVLGITTALSRMLTFSSLERLGGTEVALIGLLELLVSLGLAFLLLGERLTPLQWVGGVVLVAGVLIGRRQARRSEIDRWWEKQQKEKQRD
ncbi:MAG: DMT family transporter [Anaerolineae bacterium]|nr:DMT family transporter [Anaerolineae bacterium]